MVGFEPGSSDVRSNHSANCTTATALKVFFMGNNSLREEKLKRGSTQFKD